MKFDRDSLSSSTRHALTSLRLMRDKVRTNHGMLKDLRSGFESKKSGATHRAW